LTLFSKTKLFLTNTTKHVIDYQLETISSANQQTKQNNNKQIKWRNTNK